MQISRRTLGPLAAGAALAITASQSAFAQSADDKALTDTIEELRLGLMNKDKAKLEAVAADNMSYGHSAGRIENKKEFVDAVLARKAVVKAQIGASGYGMIRLLATTWILSTCV